MRTRFAVAAAAVLLAGCTAAAQSGNEVPRGQVPAARTELIRDRALSLARRLVGELRPPPGTKPVHLQKLPPPLNQPQAPLLPGWVRVTESLEAPAGPKSAWTALLARTPLKVGPVEPGGNAVTVLPAPEPGIDVAELSVALVQLSRSMVLIAAEAQAAWLPARTAAEHLNPAGFRSVTISVQPWQSRMTKRTVTTQADIARLTSIINAGVPAPPSVAGGMSCAPLATVYTLRFTPRAAAGPSAVVTLGACPQAYAITVNGKQQPSLWDNGKLRTAAGNLLRIRYPLG
jgi:outer membrane murein-binding lipoprotein Lpp